MAAFRLRSTTTVLGMAFRQAQRLPFWEWRFDKLNDYRFRSGVSTSSTTTIKREAAQINLDSLFYVYLKNEDYSIINLRAATSPFALRTVTKNMPEPMSDLRTVTLSVCTFTLLYTT